MLVSVSNFAMVAVSYGPLGMQSEHWTLETALLLLGGFTLATLSFGALFMFYVPANMRATFYKYKTWGMHLDTYWWDDKIFDENDGIELRGHEAVRANLPMWNSGKLLLRASHEQPACVLLVETHPFTWYTHARREQRYTCRGRSSKLCTRRDGLPGNMPFQIGLPSNFKATTAFQTHSSPALC